MKNKTNIFKKFINSIYNLDEFPKYIRDGVGKAVLYALLLSIFLGGIKGITGVIDINSSINEAIETISEEKNKFLISNNELDLESSPIKIENRGVLFYADENVKISEVSSLKSMTVHEDINFLMLKDGLYIETNSSSIETSVDNVELYYSDLDLGDGISNLDVIDNIESVKPMLSTGIIIFYMIEEFLEYMMSAFLIALLTVIPIKLLGVNFGLSNVFSLVIYAYTLPNLLVLILSIIFPGILFDTAGMVGAMVYTYLAIKNIKQSLNRKVG